MGYGAYEWVMAHMNESCGTYEWVMKQMTRDSQVDVTLKMQNIAKHCKTTRCDTLQHQGLMTHTLTWLTWLAKCNTLQHTATPMTHDSYIDMTRLIRWHDSQQACRKVKCWQEPHTYAAKRTERTEICLQTCLLWEGKKERKGESEREKERECVYRLAISSWLDHVQYIQ